jgi:hypothetical protein
MQNSTLLIGAGVIIFIVTLVFVIFGLVKGFYKSAATLAQKVFFWISLVLLAIGVVMIATWYVQRPKTVTVKH